MLFRYTALIESFVAFGREGVSVEGDERVFRAMLLEAVVEGEEAGEVGCVRNEGRPYCDSVSMSL